MTMTWQELVRDLMQQGYSVGEVFTLEDFFSRYEGELNAAFPGSNTHRESLRKTFQELRRSDEVEFIDYEGTYRRK